MSISFQCTCGETIVVPEQNAGQEIRCSRCSTIVRVPGNAVNLLGYEAPAEGPCMVTPRATEMIRQTTLWVRIMSILLFVVCGMMVLVGGGLFFVGFIGGRAGGPPAFLGCAYIPLALLYVVPGVFLWRYATHTKTFALTRNEQSLEDALQAQKSFWKYVAITALVMIGLYLLIIVVALGVGVFAATRHI